MARATKGEGVKKRSGWFPPIRQIICDKERSGEWQQFSPQTLGFVNERSFICLRQEFPVRAQPLRYLGVVHLWVLLCHLPPLTSGPDHEGIHRPLYVIHWLRPRTHRNLQLAHWDVDFYLQISSLPALMLGEKPVEDVGVTLWLVSVRLTVQLPPW